MADPVLKFPPEQKGSPPRQSPRPKLPPSRAAG
jgi:hypothetical protein